MSPSLKESLPEAWLKKLTALKEYWRDSVNQFKLPYHYKDLESGLNYKFFNHYVTNISDNVPILSAKYKLLVQAIKAAKSQRTTHVNKVLKQKSRQCSYMSNQSSTSRCKIVIKYGRLCRHHRKLSVEDLRRMGNYFMVNGRQRDYKSTCLYKKSTIHNAGHGVFATRHFYPGDLITIYSFSEIISSESMPTLKGKLEYNYVLKKCFIGLTTPTIGKGLGSFINAPGSSKFNVNCKYQYDKISDTPYLVATKHIWKGSELFMAYNKGQLAKR